ncbi:MAG: YidC/Oxa1 family membrane protein insertase [Bacilli bacterium]
MKKNKTLKIFIILFLLISLTGCTKILKDDKGKAVTNKLTGQSLTENILCQPTEKETIKIYEDNKIDLSKLPKCENLKVFSGNYDGIWTTIFVKPLAFVIVKLGVLFKSYGLAIILITLIIRLVMYPVTKNTAMQSENMKKAKPELDFLEKKYKNKQDSDSMMLKSQEMMAIYKKYNINPMTGCLFSFIQIPLFFAFYEALNRLPSVFEGTFLGFQMGMSPLTGLTTGHYQYLIIIILVIIATYLSFKLNATASMGSEQEKQMKMMTNMMLIFIAIASFSISTGIAIYWITNNIFTIIQNLIVKRRIQK